MLCWVAVAGCEVEVPGVVLEVEVPVVCAEATPSDSANTEIDSNVFFIFSKLLG